MSESVKKLDQLIQLVSRLRAPDGCPWDRKQSPRTIKSYLLEETHEVMAAIDTGQPENVREELGDLLFIITMLCRLYQEEGHFSMQEVLTDINTKMTNRHPHVFGEMKKATEQELRDHWLKMKQQEKTKKDTDNPLFSSIPRTLPSLKRAHRISEQAAHMGFEWSSLEQVFDKCLEEITELKEALAEKKPGNTKEEIGDLLLVIVNIGRLIGVGTEEALAAACEKFIFRFTSMHQEITRSGDSLTELETEKLLQYWQDTKNVNIRLK